MFRFAIALAISSPIAIFGMPKLTSHSAIARFSDSPSQSAPAYKPHFAFDVAAIHESRDDGMSSIDNIPGSSVYIVHNLRASGIVFAAYGLQILATLVNAPAWANTTRYDLQAQSDPDTDAALAKLSESDFQAEKQHMLQDLLASRFHLRIHPETRITTIYELVATARTKQRMLAVSGPLGNTISSCSPVFLPQKGEEIRSTGCPFHVLFSHLENEQGTVILDHTGLTGAYAYHLAFRPQGLREDFAAAQYPDLPTALREQLGLELRPAKGPVTFWVIDHMEHPTPN